MNFLFGKKLPNCQNEKYGFDLQKRVFHVRNGTNSSELKEMKFQIAILL
jgi:hypothetical protein